MFSHTAGSVVSESTPICTFTMCDESLLLLLDSSWLSRQRTRKRKRDWVNDILCKRGRYGEFHHLYKDLHENETKHFAYFRMKRETFCYILAKVEDRLQKFSNFRETISPEERLALTLR